MGLVLVKEVANSIVVDWGSSNFRAYLLSPDGMKQAMISSERGIKSMASTGFANYLCAQLAPWQASGRLPVLLCGMVGSNIGWHEVPYIPAPCSLEQLAAGLYRVAEGDIHGWIVPGLSARNPWAMPDAMRGEEMQALGWQRLHGTAQGQHALCLPGTHNKWVTLQHGQLTGFATAMTGECYQLITRHSILSGDTQDFDRAAFQCGVEQAIRHPGVLHQLFSARSQVLIGELAAEHSHSYISGLLIGDEVAQMQRAGQLQVNTPIALLGERHLCVLYQSAIELIGLHAAVYDAEQCLLAAASYLLEYQGL